MEERPEEEGRGRRRGKANTLRRPTYGLRTGSELCPTVNDRMKKEEKCVGIPQLGAFARGPIGGSSGLALFQL